MSDDDDGTCGLCGMDPVSHLSVPIGVTFLNLCDECYDRFHAASGTERKEEP